MLQEQHIIHTITNEHVKVQPLFYKIIVFVVISYFLKQELWASECRCYGFQIYSPDIRYVASEVQDLLRKSVETLEFNK